MIRATLSIGATLARSAESVDTVTARADEAMYRAKSGDRNTVVPN
jgi:GGDEF domain-containing protein